MTDKHIVNGIYETTPGKLYVYLGYFKGFEIDKYDFHAIKGYLYWDITDRYGKDGKGFRKGLKSEKEYEESLRRLLEEVLGNELSSNEQSQSTRKVNKHRSK